MVMLKPRGLPNKNLAFYYFFQTSLNAKPSDAIWTNTQLHQSAVGTGPQTPPDTPEVTYLETLLRSLIVQTAKSNLSKYPLQRLSCPSFEGGMAPCSNRCARQPQKPGRSWGLARACPPALCKPWAILPLLQLVKTFLFSFI